MVKDVQNGHNELITTLRAGNQRREFCQLEIFQKEDL